MKEMRLEDVKNFYNSYNYPDGFEKRKLYWKEHLSKHIELDNLKGKRVLDVGGGAWNNQ